MQKNQSLVDSSLLVDFHRIVSFSTGCWICYFSVVMWHSNQTLFWLPVPESTVMAAAWPRTSGIMAETGSWEFTSCVILPPTSLPKQRHLLDTKCSNAQDCKGTFSIQTTKPNKISMLSGGGALQVPQVLLKSCWQILAAARGRSTLLEGVPTGVFPVF